MQATLASRLALDVVSPASDHEVSRNLLKQAGVDADDIPAVTKDRHREIRNKTFLIHAKQREIAGLEPDAPELPALRQECLDAESSLVRLHRVGVADFEQHFRGLLEAGLDPDKATRRAEALAEVVFRARRSVDVEHDFDPARALGLRLKEERRPGGAAVQVRIKEVQAAGLKGKIRPDMLLLAVNGRDLAGKDMDAVTTLLGEEKQRAEAAGEVLTLRFRLHDCTAMGLSGGDDDVGGTAGAAAGGGSDGTRRSSSSWPYKRRAGACGGRFKSWGGNSSQSAARTSRIVPRRRKRSGYEAWYATCSNNSSLGTPRLAHYLGRTGLRSSRRS